MLSTKLVVVKGTGSGNMCDGSYNLEWTELTTIENEELPYSFGSNCKIAINETDDNGDGYYEVDTIAVAWPSAFATEYDIEGRPITEVIDTYEIAFSTDDGVTFSEPIQLNSVDVTPGPGSSCGISSPETLGITFGQEGILHAVYETVSCVEHDQFHYYHDAYYARCSAFGSGGLFECEDSIHLNSEDGSVSADNQKLPIAVYGDNVYAVWEDIRNSDTFELGNLYMGEVNSPADGTAEVIRNARVDDLDDLWSAVPSIVVDREGNDPSLVVTWSGIDIANIRAKVYLARWNEAEETFGSSAVVSDVEDGYLAYFSHITADRSNTYHIVYNYVPFGGSEFDLSGSGIRYAVGTYADSVFNLANSENIFTGMAAQGSLSTIGDLAGRTYVFWQATSDSYEYNSEIYLSIGTQ
jgi:hypothetical protein